MDQLRECSCGTLTNNFRCPDCDKPAYPLWTVHTPSGRCVGYVSGVDAKDAIDSIQLTSKFDKHMALQPRPSYNTPEQGPLG